MSSTHYGSCLCNQISYEVSGGFDGFFLCHCTYCQKDTGSAHGANLVSSTAKIKWVKGEDKVKSFTLAGTRHVKAFCSVCGSAMPSLAMNGAMLVVPAGSLDSKVPQAPTAHLFYESKASWENDLDSLKKFAKLP